MKDNRIRAFFVALAAAVVLAAGAHGAAADTSDGWITTKAKIALLTTKDLSATSINVDTIDGKVTLHGTVPTDAEKTRAESVASKIDGVKSVKNLLQVVPPKAEDKVAANDEQIKDRVETALENDQRLAGSKIEVASVNKGVVLLEGNADSMTDHLEALNAAGKVAGVRRVESEIKAPDTMSNAAPAPADRRVAAEGDRGVVNEATATASDVWITSATKMRLLADGDTPALDINVDTDDGVVTLFGIVPSEAAKNAAETNARKVNGVKSVRNELQVVADKKREAVDAKDADIERGVAKTLEQSAALDKQDIDVSVKDGVVRLTGSVDSEDDRLSAGFAARSTPGVRAVLIEDLRVNGRG